MKIGYARVSTREQNLHLQLDALRKAGCETIYQEKVTGEKTDRPELAKLLTSLCKGDAVCVYRLDRLGWSMKHLLGLVSELEQQGVDLISLTDALDTTTAQGRLIFNTFASLSEFERGLIRERTLAGLEAARSRGRKGGRRRGLSEEAQRTAILAETLYREQILGVNAIADQLRISKATLYKYLRFRGVNIGSKHVPVSVSAPP